MSEYPERRRLLSAAKDLMSDIQQHTKSLYAALNLINSESAEKFHADEILQDTIMLEMILEEFRGDVPEEFESFQKVVEQRKKMYGDLFGDQFYERRRTDLEEELSEAASVPEATEAEKEHMRKEARKFFPRPGYEKKEKQKEPEKGPEPTGKVVMIYSHEAWDQFFRLEEDKTVQPLEARLEPGDELFSELPEHYTVVCVEEDQQLKVDTLQTINANPYYRLDRKVEARLHEAAESGRNLFRLQQLFDRLMEEEYG